MSDIVRHLFTMGSPSTNDHRSSESVDPSLRSATTARAFAIVDSIFNRLRTIPASPISLATRLSLYLAILSTSKPSNARL
jgi:hypothetical protein